MSKLDKKRWGHLAERFSAPGPRKMLALDGGQFLPWPPLSGEVADLDG